MFANHYRVATSRISAHFHPVGSVCLARGTCTCFATTDSSTTNLSVDSGDNNNNDSHQCFVYVRVSCYGRWVALGIGTSSTRMSHPGCGGGSNAPVHVYTELYFSCACAASVWCVCCMPIVRLYRSPPQTHHGQHWVWCSRPQALFLGFKRSGPEPTRATHANSPP